jgi:hypothetical protein
MNAFNITVKLARRIAVTIVGVTILAIGLIMIVAPGPAIVVIPIGLAILGLEFAWARHWLKRIRQGISAGNSKRRGDRAEYHRDRHSSS